MTLKSPKHQLSRGVALKVMDNFYCLWEIPGNFGFHSIRCGSGEFIVVGSKQVLLPASGRGTTTLLTILVILLLILMPWWSPMIQTTHRAQRRSGLSLVWLVLRALICIDADAFQCLALWFCTSKDYCLLNIMKHFITLYLISAW